MKTKSILKIAVVATAALAAYAFNGSNANDLKPFYLKEGGVCTNILAGCSDSGNFKCKIISEDSPDVFGLDCERIIMHTENEVVQWQPVNL